MKTLELYHHGIKGQKWGVRRYQNYDGSRIKEHQRYEKGFHDDVLAKGASVQRVYVPFDNVNENDYRNERLYVSENPIDYWSLPIENNSDKSIRRLATYEVKEKMRIAGQKAINNILKDIGEEPLVELRNPNSAWFWNNDFINEMTDDRRDFLNTNEELGRKFIKRALEKGYDGIYDPVDSNIGQSVSDGARIIFNKNKLVKVKDIPMNDYLEEGRKKFVEMMAAKGKTADFG